MGDLNLTKILLQVCCLSLFLISSGCSHDPVIAHGEKSDSISSGEKLAGRSPASSDRGPRIENADSDSIASSGGAGIIDWPVDSAVMSRGFSINPTGKRKKPHLGIDLAARRGTPIYAAQDGLVIYSGHAFKGYGRMVLIEGSDDLATLYGHMDKIKIRQGKHVRKGDLIGLMGRSGRATGVHLHFEVRRQKRAVDPFLYLPHARVAQE